MKVLIIDPLSEKTIYRLKEIMDLEINYLPGLDENEILQELNDTSILIMRTSYIFSEEWLKCAPKLIAVIVAGNGTENVPINLLKRNNIIFKNVKAASVSSVAEYVVCLMLMGLRNIMEGIRSVEEGKWKKPLLIGNEIKEKTIGLIGFGNIGKSIAELLDKFNVKIIYNNETGPVENSLYEYVELKELAKKSDIISIQVPLTNSTKHFIDKDFFSNIKKDCILINASRYEVINMDQLIDKLKQGFFKHVYIDPIEIRHLKEISKTENLPISFLPHLGANTYEAQERIGGEVIKIVIQLMTKVSMV